MSRYGGFDSPMGAACARSPGNIVNTQPEIDVPVGVGPWRSHLRGQPQKC